MSIISWPHMRLSDCTEFVLDGTHGSPVRTESGIPVLSAANVKNGRLSYATERFTTTEEYEAYQRRLNVAKGDILLTIVGTIGRVAIVDEVHPHVFQRSVAVLRPRRDVLDSRYLFHALTTTDITAQLSARTNQSAQAGVYLGALKEIIVPTPPLSEQRRIADILDRADAIRRKRKESIALTEELLRSAFLEMFGDPVTNPKGWRPSTFGDQLELLEYGPRFYNEKYSDDGVRIVRITDLDSIGRLDFSAMPRLAVNERDRMRYILRPGDVIFARSGATVGKTALSMPGDPEAIPGAYFIRLRFKSEVKPLFARQVLASDRVQQIIVSRSRQSAQQNFSGPGIRELPLPVPPVALQERLEKIASGRQALLQHNKRADAESEAMFASLIQRAFSGQLARLGAKC